TRGSRRTPARLRYDDLPWSPGDRRRTSAGCAPLSFFTAGRGPWALGRGATAGCPPPITRRSIPTCPPPASCHPPPVAPSGPAAPRPGPRGRRRPPARLRYDALPCSPGVRRRTAAGCAPLSLLTAGRGPWALGRGATAGCPPPITRRSIPTCPTPASCHPPPV